jgi:hypothetical protein
MELLVVQQQRFGGSIGSTVARVGLGGIFRGFVPTATREGIWTVGYLSIPPMFRKYLIENHGSSFSENGARLAASIGAALISSIISHPFDTVKTCMQGDLERKTYSTMMKSFGELHRQGGITAFYRGYGWRYGRQVSTGPSLSPLQ